MTTDTDALDLIDTATAAEILGIKPSSLTQARWRGREPLPPPDLMVSGRPVWRRATIVEYAARRDPRWRARGRT